MILTSINSAGDFLSVFSIAPGSAAYFDFAEAHGANLLSPDKALPVFLRKGEGFVSVGHTVEMVDGSEFDSGATEYRHGPRASGVFRVRAHRAPLLRAALEYHRTNRNAHGVPSAVGLLLVDRAKDGVTTERRRYACLLETQQNSGAGARLFRELARFVRA